VPEEQNRLLESVKEDIAGATGESSQEKIAFFIIGLALAVVACSIYVFGSQKYKNSQISSLDQQINDEVTTPLKNLSEEKAQADLVLSQIDALTTSLSKRIKYDQILKDFRDNQYKSARWTSFGFNDNGKKITISGVAGNFDDVAKTVAAIKGMKAVQDVKLVSVSINADSKEVNFTIDAEVDFSPYKLLSANKSEAQSAATPSVSSQTTASTTQTGAQ
jgi:Tfp pilus assembly protein PilN